MISITKRIWRIIRHLMQFFTFFPASIVIIISFGSDVVFLLFLVVSDQVLPIQFLQLVSVALGLERSYELVQPQLEAPAECLVRDTEGAEHYSTLMLCLCLLKK